MNTRPSDHIPIVDHDREIPDLLSTYLVQHGLRVAAGPTGRHIDRKSDEEGKRGEAGGCRII